jgi:transposase
MDNARFHHCIEITTLLRDSGFILLYLPPYSPFLNPIENSFSKWKSHVISLNPTNENQLVEYITNTAGLFSVSDFQGFWRNMCRFISRSLLREEIDS